MICRGGGTRPLIAADCCPSRIPGRTPSFFRLFSGSAAMNKGAQELAGPRATDAWSGIIHPPMPDIPFTKEQRQAIEATGRSVIVSAAAGSGKTAVLAERCAYLVCDAPEGDRCDVDELLVLTFTESAASEMRSRIVQAIRGRMERRPADLRLREQAALVDAARISTIHAFCNWLVRRWFNWPRPRTP